MCDLFVCQITSCQILEEGDTVLPVLTNIDNIVTCVILLDTAVVYCTDHGDGDAVLDQLCAFTRTQ